MQINRPPFYLALFICGICLIQIYCQRFLLGYTLIQLIKMEVQDVLNTDGVVPSFIDASALVVKRLKQVSDLVDVSFLQLRFLGLNLFR
jgi:hypothetical protein